VSSRPSKGGRATAPRKNGSPELADYSGREIVRLMTSSRWVMVVIVVLIIILVLAETLAGGFW
jgi:hypothetical protein